MGTSGNPGNDRRTLPDKLYYSIREVSEFTGVEAHVLRYWEQEFPSLKPKRARSGSRNYRRRDIEEILTIRTLLHEKGYRIDGARRHLLELKRATRQGAPQLAIPFNQLSRTEKLQEVRRCLQEIQGLVKQMKADAGKALEAEG